MTTIESMKSQAKRLRNHFASQQIELSHSQALEAIAATHGFRDWNTASALSPSDLIVPPTDDSMEQLLEKFQAEANRYKALPVVDQDTADDHMRRARVLMAQIGKAHLANQKAEGS